jgi:hypothetical protein
MFDGEDALADWHAVERHLDHGRSLFADLRKRDRVKLS